jgi:hypothetical protein
MNKSLKNPIKLKDGTEYAVGTNFELKWLADKPSITVLVASDGREIKVGSIRLHKYFGTPKPPATNTLMKWEFDRGVCKTILGNVTEPDGHDEHGAPSWMLVMGVI